MIRPTRTSGGIAALALALAVTALLLENPAAAFAAGSLALFLLWRGWWFERDIAAAVTSLTVTRTVDRTILRQGTAATVRVQINLTAPPGMDIRVRDRRRTAISGQSILGFRPYQTGDDPNLIDWKITARRDALYVRQMTGLSGGRRGRHAGR